MIWIWWIPYWRRQVKSSAGSSQSILAEQL
jgi:hypothetical protein